MGIIEKLELHQFMCHKYLEFNFGPQINFIIGECMCLIQRTVVLYTMQAITEVSSIHEAPSYIRCQCSRCTGGKSAVLSALTVALGGKANTTGRGRGLKSFIREGQSCVALSSTYVPMQSSISVL